MKSADERDIESLMQRYFDGLHHADSTVLRTVFHPKLAYVNATAGNHEFLDFAAYMTRIENRISPAERGETRNEGIDRITVDNGQMGFVEAHMTMIGRDYQDLLTLLRTDEGWKVITKVFAYQEEEL